MLVGAATLQGMHFAIPPTLAFLSSEGSEIRQGKQQATIPTTEFADELAIDLGLAIMDRWWLEGDKLINDPDVSWTYRGSDNAVTTLVSESSSFHIIRGTHIMQLSQHVRRQVAPPAGLPVCSGPQQDINSALNAVRRAKAMVIRLSQRHDTEALRESVLNVHQELVKRHSAPPDAINQVRGYVYLSSSKAAWAQFASLDISEQLESEMEIDQQSR